MPELISGIDNDFLVIEVLFEEVIAALEQVKTSLDELFLIQRILFNWENKSLDRRFCTLLNRFDTTILS